MKKLTFMFVMLLMAALGFAQETATATWVASEQGYANGEAVEAFTINAAVSATTDAGTNSNAPKYYDTGTALRLYGSNSLTLTCVTNLTKVVITYSGTSYAGEVSANVGTYALDGAVGTWTGEAKSVTFTRGGTSGHVRIQKIEVTYVKPGPFDNVKITPAAGEVEKLGLIVLDFTEQYNAGMDVRSVWGGVEDPYIIVNGDESTKTSQYLNDLMDGTFEIDFYPEMTDPGTYKLVIPAGNIEIDYEPNPELVFNYTIKGEEPPVDPMTLMVASPAAGVVKALSTVELTFGDLELSVKEDAEIVLKKDGEEFAYFFGYTDGEENKTAFFEDVDGARYTDAGEYQLVIPANTITAGGLAVGEITLDYTIKAKQVLEGNPFTWIASQQLFDNAQKLDELGAIPLVDGYTLTFDPGTNNNATPTPPTYYDNGEAVRVYKGNTVTLEGKNITKVVFTYLSGNAGAISSEPEGVVDDAEALTLTWTGKTDKVVFSNDLEAGVQLRFTQMEVTYEEEPPVPVPTVDEIIEVAAITPAANSTVESLSDFELSYGDFTPLTAKEDAEVTLTKADSEEVVANGMMEVNADGNKISIGLESPVTAPGTYQLNIPADAITAQGVSINMPQSFKYTIASAEEYTIDPAEGEVESLSTFTITFNNYMVDVNEDEAVAFLMNTETEEETPASIMAIGGGKKVYISLESEVTAPGQYALIIMDGSIQKTIDEKFLPELEFNYTIVGEPAPEIITLPEGLTAEYYLFKGLDSSYDEPKEKTSEVEVAIDGQDVYIKGLSISFPVEGWAKGTLEGNTLTIPQTYLGDAEIWGMVFDLSITACTFVYDAEAGTFTSEAGYNITSVEGGDADFFTNVVLTRWGEVVPATPATPEITEFVHNGDYGYYISMSIPATDVDGNNLLTSKLSYQLFYEMDGEQHPFVFTTEKYEMLTENMETIPYNFTDDWDIGKAGWQVYLNDDNVTSWDKVGVKSIYTGGGETHESEMFWYDLKSDVPVEIEDGEYINEYTDLSGNAVSGTVYIRVDGSDIYVKGISDYLPDNEIKGTLAGNVVTFAAQTVGNYGNYFTVNFLQNETVSFTYDAEAQKFTSTGEMYTWFQYGGKAYYDAYYKDAVWKKVKEMAGTPATPVITALRESEQYGWIVEFNVPVVDTEGNGMVSDKLSFQFFTDINKDVQPLVFTTAAHMYLDADMTVVPYNFTDDYDFEKGMIYLNEDYSDQWNKLGLQSIYTGGGETHESEVFWFDIKDYAATAINGISADGQNAVYFDTMGRRTNSEAKGLLIQQVRQADGTVTTRKVVRK